MTKVLITGGSGLIGRRLIELLKNKRYEIALLSRRKINIDGVKTFLWNVENNFIEDEAFEGIDFIIHLAGAGIADKRWTRKRKNEIRNSRIQSAELLHKKIAEKEIKLKAFVSASAIGYYGAVTENKVFTEDSGYAKDFIGETCYLWENAADKFNRISERVVKIRIGVVLAKEGGALPRMLLPFKFGLGSPIGSGNQIMPWIHISDIVRIFHYALENQELKGVYNAVATEQPTNREFGKILSEVLHKPYFMPSVPASLFKLIFGEMANLLLEGSKISNEKIKKSGFKFEFDNLRKTLTDLLF